MNKIFYTEEESTSCVEQLIHDSIEHKFSEALAELTMNILDLKTWSKDGQIIRDILKSKFYDELNSRKGIAQQYLNHELKIILDKFNRELKTDIKIRYDYCTHAKFDELLDYIKKVI